MPGNGYVILVFGVFFFFFFFFFLGGGGVVCYLCLIISPCYVL